METDMQKFITLLSKTSSCKFQRKNLGSGIIIEISSGERFLRFNFDKDGNLKEID
jgi:hypothetical protein